MITNMTRELESIVRTLLLIWRDRAVPRYLTDTVLYYVTLRPLPEALEFMQCIPIPIYEDDLRLAAVRNEIDILLTCSTEECLS
jgi:hypothetical protein